MHSHSIEPWTHPHSFLGDDHHRNERRTKLVVALTLLMMVTEIVAGTVFGSLALLADGWHMATHAAALGIAAFAYTYARKHTEDSRFCFGTGKVGDLAAFASALILGLIAILIAYESIVRLMSPVPIRFGEATMVAFIGLAVNLASAWLLWDPSGSHAHSHHHHEAHDNHDHNNHPRTSTDQNLRAAYVHVLADAFTSVLAIVALLAGSHLGWVWLDPIIGIVGAIVIGRWAVGLITNSAATLLDFAQDRGLHEHVRERLEKGGDRVSDLHLWQVGPGHHAAIISLVSDTPQSPEHYKEKLETMRLSHLTVEVHKCGHD
jgi:cation diffusion facilitator family transporter